MVAGSLELFLIYHKDHRLHRKHSNLRRCKGNIQKLGKNIMMFSISFINIRNYKGICNTEIEKSCFKKLLRQIRY